MNEPPNSIICFIRCNYKVASSIICIIYFIISFICLIKFTLNIPDAYAWILCKFIAGGIKASISIFISSTLAIIGMFLDVPVLMVPLMLMHIIVFATMKLLFYEILMENRNVAEPPMLWIIFLCIVFVIVSTIILWVLYCAFVQISMNVLPDSPVSCRIRRFSISSSTSKTTRRNATSGISSRST